MGRFTSNVPLLFLVMPILVDKMVMNSMLPMLEIHGKTLGMNDWYLAGPDTPFPLGNLQMLGKLHAAHVKKAKPWVPDWMLTMITDRSIDLYLTTEDLPDPDNRITVDGDRITVR